MKPFGFLARVLDCLMADSKAYNHSRNSSSLVVQKIQLLSPLMLEILKERRTAE